MNSTDFYGLSVIIFFVGTLVLSAIALPHRAPLNLWICVLFEVASLVLLVTS